MDPLKRLSLTYWLISLLNILAVSLTVMGVAGLMPMDYITKVLLMPALMTYWYFGIGNRAPQLRNLMLAALFFSWVGDVTLMIAGMQTEQNQQMLWFLIGLVGFLITHLCYINYFRGEFKAGGQPSALLKRPTLVMPVVLLGGIMLYLILPKLPLVMQIAVATYSLVLMSMVLSALNRMDQVPRNSFRNTYFGAQLFMISDGMIAYNHFYEHVKWAGPFIMVTYIAGQYFIVQGVLQAVDYSAQNKGINS